MAVTEKSPNSNNVYEDEISDNSQEPINPDLVQSDNLLSPSGEETLDVGLTDDELEKLEVVEDDGDDEEPIKQDISDNLQPNNSDNSLDEDSDNLEDDEDEGEDEEELPTEQEVITTSRPKKSVFQQLNEERQLQRKLSTINFLKEYSKNPHRSIENVANKLSLASSTCRKYLTEYIDKVKEAVKLEKYPNHVLNYYNSDKFSDEKRLKFYHVDKLKDIVLRYSNFDIDLETGNKSLNTMDAQGLNSKSNLSDENNNISLLGSPSDKSIPQQQQQQQQLQQQSSYNDIDELNYGITTFQLIRFGLYHIFGQRIAQVITKMLGPNPDEYLSSELKMKNLLMMSNITELKADRFIEWLKSNAKYVAHPSGFLGYNQVQPAPVAQGQQPQYYGGVGNINGGNSGSNVDMNDPLIHHLYATQVYIPGLPPNHPENVRALREHKERQYEEEQSKLMDKRINTIMKTKLLDVMDTSNKPQQNGMFSPEMMVAMGMAELVPVTDVDGNTQMKLVPRGSQQNQQSQQNPAEQMTAQMQMFKEMISFMTSLQKQNQPAQQTDIMGMILPQIVNRVFNDNPNSKLSELVQTFEIMNKLRGDMNPGMNSGGSSLPPEATIQLERMKLDKEFAMQQFDLKREQQRIERERLEKQDQEASHNVDKLMDGINQVAPMLMGIVQQFLMGNRGQPQPGQPGMPGAAAAPNTAEVLLKMEYEKQRREDEERKEQKRREWEAEVARKNADANANPYGMVNPTVYQPNVQPPQQQQQPDTTHVHVNPRQSEHDALQQQQPEVYTESDFIKYSPEELEAARFEAMKEKKRLESYISSMSAVLQNKLMNGEGIEYDEQPYNELTEPEEPVVQKTITTTTTVTKKKDPSMEDILNASSNAYDPDYDGVVVAENVDIDDKTGETGEEVDI